MTNSEALRFEKIIKYVSWIATVLAVLMYVSYIPQIQANLAGNKGTPIQPLVAALNCSLWTFYALFKRERDYSVALANFPGIIFGIIAFITAI